jgi:sulfite exporter TauE/SafE
MELELSTVFIIGFLGGFSHCIGMCGGFVLTYSIKLQENSINTSANNIQKVYPHLLYSAGRILSYMILGEIFGLIGGTLEVVFAIRHFQGALQLIAGVVMIIIGLDLAGWIPGWQPDSFPGFRWYKKMVEGMFNRVRPGNIFGLGFVLGFIPCGLVYAAGAYAAATGSFFGGMITMLAFGLGTLPAMVVFGIAAQRLSQSFRNILYKLASFAVIVLGILTILRGIDALGWIRIYWIVQI